MTNIETIYTPLTKEFNEELFNQLAMVNSEFERIGAEERLEIECKTITERILLFSKYTYPHFRINLKMHDVVFTQMDTYHVEVVDAYLKGILFTTIIKHKPEDKPEPVTDEFIIRHSDWKTSFHPEIKYHPWIAKVNAVLRNHYKDETYQVYICSRIRYTNKSQYTECKITCNKEGDIKWFDVSGIFSKDAIILNLQKLIDKPGAMYSAISNYLLEQANNNE